MSNQTDRGALLNFNSDFRKLDRIETPSQDVIKKEPMLFGAGWDFAWNNGGPLTRQFMSSVVDNSTWGYKKIRSAVIDSRVHMLMPGWYPCIPGWHLDDVPRTREDGQPDHANPSYNANHVLMIVGDASRTEFVLDRLQLRDVLPNQGTVYEVWNNEIEQLCENGNLRTRRIESGDVIEFDSKAFHRGMPATKNGWRFFIRLSVDTERPILNEMRTQVQVYMSSINAGW